MRRANSSEYTRKEVLLSSIFNNGRVANQRINPLKQYFLAVLKSDEKLENSLEKLINYSFPKRNDLKLIKFKSDNVIEECIKHSLKIEFDSELDRSIFNNILLTYNKELPLIQFAFNNWYDLNDQNDNLVELSRFYLGKFNEVDIPIGSEYGEMISKGAYNYIHTDKKYVYKIPANKVAQEWINKVEFDNYNILSTTELNNFLPKYISINKDGVIKKEYIKGRSCHELLSSGISQEIRNQVREFYNLYVKNQSLLKYKLDIHPGNFIYDEDLKRIYFIDIGPIPHIGENYYDLTNFDKYFQKVWLDRLRLIKEEPIRSVDLSLH